jgi:myosin heavy subunit
MASGNWERSPVWFSLSDESPWIPGQVISCHTLPSSTPSGNEEIWIFEILDIGTKDHHQIQTKPFDRYALEFHRVKRRDELAETSFKEITDMTSLSYLNEPEMIECLRVRYDHQMIYTNIGPILVAVNPFEQLDQTVYSLETIMKYSQSSDPSSAKLHGPHVFQVSQAAYQKMFIDKYDANKRENQAILVNGESGAGKTESTKQVLRYLAVNSSQLAIELDVVDDSEADIEALINAVNPITESFGNAKTSRNNNSSRFGKFIELCYAGSGYIIGAHIQTYLLETIRVVSQVKGERNYHIFYEVFSGLSEEQRDDWCCHDLTTFHYLNQSQEFQRYDGESDVENFSRVIDALRTINLSMEQITSILQIIVAILHLGNIEFSSSQTVGDDAALLSPHSSLHTKQVCHLLSVDEDHLSNALTKRGLKVAGNFILKNLNLESAMVARDTYAKTLYDLLFKTLLSFVNSSLSLDNNSRGDEQASSIGVLDIFGFEYFEKNSFEQLWFVFLFLCPPPHFPFLPPPTSPLSPSAASILRMRSSKITSTTRSSRASRRSTRRKESNGTSPTTQTTLSDWSSSNTSALVSSFSAMSS